MSKVAILNDTHCGIRNSSEIFIEYQEKFYRDVFFPYCDEHNIKQIVHLGDYYDHRKNINFKALRRNRYMFLEPMKERRMKMDIIPGNHDTFHKNTNALCSLKELLGYYTSTVNIFMKPTKVNYGGEDIHFIPWINEENYKTSIDYIKQNKGILMAHLELTGFDMMKGMVNKHGMDHNIFSNYDMVLSGHFHTKSSKDNVHYLGSQMEFTWNDAGDPKYFHILDTESGELTPVLNPNPLFEKVYYDDTNKDYHKIDVGYLRNKFVKVIVDKKNDPFMFDKFVDRISDLNTHELKIVENFQEFLGENVEANMESVENTSELMMHYIDSVTTDLDKDRVKTLMNSLHTEALDMEIQ